MYKNRFAVLELVRDVDKSVHVQPRLTPALLERHNRFYAEPLSYPKEPSIGSDNVEVALSPKGSSNFDTSLKDPQQAEEAEDPEEAARIAQIAKERAQAKKEAGALTTVASVTSLPAAPGNSQSKKKPK